MLLTNSQEPGSDNGKNHNGVDKPTSGPPPPFDWAPPSSCYDHRHKLPTVVESVQINRGKPLSITQTVSKEDSHHNGWSPSVSGEIYLRESEKGEEAGKIRVEGYSNSEDLSVTFDYDTEAFKVITPRNVEWDRSRKAPCIQLRITLWLPAGSSFKYFGASAIQLDIITTEGFNVAADDHINLATVSGDIVTPNGKDGDLYTFDSRRISINTVSGDVVGQFPLYDSLKIESASGNVHIDVEPKPVDKDTPLPAELKVTTVSGDVKVIEPIKAALQLPHPEANFEARNYVVHVESASGNIRGEYAISSSTAFHSVSGNINVDLWPILDPRILESDETVSLATQTSSGDHKVNLLEPTWASIVKTDAPAVLPPRDRRPIFDEDPYLIIHPHEMAPQSAPGEIGSLSQEKNPLSSLQSKHQSISGTVSLRYPSVWEGSLHATTISGSQKVRGKGLEVTKKGRFPREISGKKGKGHSWMEIESMSGDQDILVGA